MKKIFVLLLVAMLFAACGSHYRLPKSEVDQAIKIVAGDAKNFRAHYIELWQQQRPPSAVEYGYWAAKWEQLQAIYIALYEQASVEDFDGGGLLGLIKDMASVYGVTP